ncbi:MAG: amino acid transporter [Gammaproteobacteria bacterium]|nr:MAG: amino acid transporter [Gammaproteobacteria bacterium]
MSFYPLIYGFFLTLGIIMPLGAQNIFMLNQGLRQSRFIDSWPAILSATICDAILIGSAIFGLSLIVFQIAWLKNTILLIGGSFLCYLSYSLWRNELTSLSEVNSCSWIKQMGYSISVSLLNPHALMDAFLIIGSNTLLFTTTQSKMLFGFSCVITEFFWFSFLCFVGNRLRRVPNNNFFVRILNRVAALIVIIIAISMFINIFYTKLLLN